MSNFEERRTQAFKQFWEITKQSWTYARFTDDEKKELISVIDFASLNLPKRATQEEMYKTFYCCYRAFLYALGYRKDPIDWRKPIDKHIEIYECNNKETIRVL